MNKREMRKMLRARFEGPQARAEQSRHLCQHVLESPIYNSARVLGGYMPMNHEADITPILQDALQKGKTLALPLCGNAPDMTFRRITRLEDLRVGAYGLQEPADETELIALARIDLLLVPLEGIDTCGYRLGKGGGYYDKALASYRGMTMGCALSWQWVDEVPHDPWDVKLHACADAKGIQKFMM